MANSHFSEKRWKYVSIGLMAVLAVGFSFPQALAAPIDISKTVLDILNNTKTLLTQSNSISSTTTATQNAVSDPQNGLPAVQSQLDEIQDQLDGQSSGIQSVVVRLGADPADGEAEEVVVLPEVEGKSYTGHMQLELFKSGNSVTTFCKITPNSAVALDAGTFSTALSTDFTCLKVYFSVYDEADGSEKTGAGWTGIISYTEISDTVVLETTP